LLRLLPTIFAGVPSISGVHQPVHGRSLVLGSQMGVAHDHLERPVAEQLCDGAQIHSGHHESTGKSVAVAMPGVALNPGFFSAVGHQPPIPVTGPRCGSTGKQERSLPS
jgi:hypothetical protein